ncbi:acid protease [Sphaerulina musiva SO2202]|uniref:Acid protease n=1 Tax=Sphaerulina musiva (strain SO2202) TaxID=692275 RepID=N1QF76_SPHMS|nr:acid protease [Sphaerulina musiva SO2202]EMF11908.1 acid protease [Sphaerulina musiva SO2202]
MAVLRYLFALAIAVTGPIATNAISSPVFQSHGKATKEELAARALAKAKYPRSNTRVTADAGYWYASFDIGDSKGLSLILDTGSDYVSVNPRLYKPGSASVDVGEEGVYTYSSMEENGCGSAAVSYHAYRDTMTYEGLTVKGQSLGASKEMPESPGNYTKFDHDGLIGLTLSPASSLANTKSTYLNSLCHQKLIEPCRLGLAFGFDKTGTMALGAAEDSLFEGPLSTMPAGPNWATTGKLVIHGTEVIAHGKEIYYDSGTRNVVVQTAVARALFKALKIQSVEQHEAGCSSIVYGYYPCDKPPQVGFQVGDKTFNIDASQFALEDNGNNNCTAVVTGIDFDFAPDWWLVGQAWFQGKYADFHRSGGDEYTFGVAHLK